LQIDGVNKQKQGSKSKEAKARKQKQGSKSKEAKQKQ
jgi:hypothetical protein